MPDREKILRGAECCKDLVPSDRCPEECPYLPEGHLTCGLDPFLDDVIAFLREQESVIVRCKDCKFWHDPIRCRLDSEGLKTPDDWFCADGERR